MDEIFTDQPADLTPTQLDNLNGYAELLRKKDLPSALRPHVESLASELPPMSEVVTENAVVDFAEQREGSEIKDGHKRAEVSPAHHQKHLEVASFVPDIESRSTEEQDLIGEVVEIGQEATEGYDINTSKKSSAHTATTTTGAAEFLGFKKIKISLLELKNYFLALMVNKIS